jgi:hypothetical protein
VQLTGGHPRRSKRRLPRADWRPRWPFPKVEASVPAERRAGTDATVAAMGSEDRQQ